MTFFQKAQCFVVGHTGSWNYVQDNSCQKIQVCTRCGEKSYITEHRWGDLYYPQLADCQQQRECERCSEVEYHVAHKWGAWQYESPLNCQQVRFCLRCSDREMGIVEHKWSDWLYENNTDCTQMRTCSHCGLVEKSGEEVHNWGAWGYRTTDSCEWVKICQNCRKTDFNLLDRFNHQWTEWNEDNATLSRQRLCVRCGNNKSEQLSTTFVDESGKKHAFLVYPIGTSFKQDMPGVFVAAKKSGDSWSNFKFTPYYVGNTLDISSINQSHQEWSCFVNAGANVICVGYNESKITSQTRVEVASNLIAKYIPPCN
ncbi:MAG: hypothetical protein KC421_17715 [Anaerolineales bacterium]|nr:hypothetical protein [Anaerolineales bacterium]